MLSGESTPSYLLHGPLVIPRLRAVLPHLTDGFLVMIREPVARAYSQYQMAVDDKGTEAQLAVRGRSAWVGMSFAEVGWMEPVV